MTLFRTVGFDALEFSETRELLGWSGLAAEIEVHALRGRHDEIMHQPLVGELAGLLLATIARARGGRS